MGRIIMKPFNLEEYIKNPSKKVVTRDGRNVDGIFPIAAEIEDCGKSLLYNEYGENSYTESSICDLFFAPEKKEGWISIYRGKDGPLTGNVIFASKEEVEESKRHCCGFTQELYLATAKVEWEDCDESY